MKTKLLLTCGNCKYKWIEYFEIPMNAKSFVARLKGTLCPKCASKKVYMKIGKTK